MLYQKGLSSVVASPLQTINRIYMKNKALLTLLTLSLTCSSCATYRASPLAPSDVAFIEESINAPGISVSSKAFTRKECITYLDRNVLKRGYQPLELTFYNNTDETYFFSPEGVSLPTFSTETVAKSSYTSTALRVGLYGGAAFLLVVPPLASAGVFIPFMPFFTPAVVDGICSIKSNEKLDKDFRKKAKEYLVLPPQTAETTLIFIPKGKVDSDFEITLVEKKTRNPEIIQVKD
jgi:hypothetical protein